MPCTMFGTSTSLSIVGWRAGICDGRLDGTSDGRDSDNGSGPKQEIEILLCREKAKSTS